MLILVVFKKLMLTCLKKITSFSHEFEILYYIKLKSGKYKIVYYCKKCR